MASAYAATRTVFRESWSASRPPGNRQGATKARITESATPAWAGVMASAAMIVGRRDGRTSWPEKSVVLPKETRSSIRPECPETSDSSRPSTATSVTVVVAAAPLLVRV